MNFEKVELYGFKSFADKAEIKFGDGITGIVGPNGCGKSNVADAIRWVLGEQSAKALRGSSMQDVIFNGTQSRKSLSYCEVSLFFDNSKKIFNIDYNEVIITRKLFRSGESEYFINKQPARLKDIVDLLHECGIGKEGYTIIGQGKVEEIMSAKPEDRRTIFEEATGIAKFKSRKNESERKMERTHENIVRMNDIITEIENQLTPLSHQAEKAREYNILTDQLKHHELNTYIAKVDGVESEKNKIFTRIHGVDEQIALRQSESDNAQKDYDEVFGKINAADIRLRALNEEMADKRVHLEQLSGNHKLIEERISYFNSQIERAKNEIAENQKVIESNTAKKGQDEVEVKKIKAELVSLNERAEKLSKELLSVTEQITLGEELATKNQQKFIQSLESLSDIKLNQGTMSVEKNNLIEKLKELNLRQEDLTKKRDSAFVDKDKCDKNIDDFDREIFDLKNQINTKEEKIKQNNVDIDKLSNTIFVLNSEISSHQTKDAFLKSLKENYEGFAPAVKNLFTKAKEDASVGKHIKGVVAELVKCDKKFDYAIETALGGASQNIVTATIDDAKFLIEYLKTNKLGRLTFLPITSVKERVRDVVVISALKERGVLGVANDIVKYDREYKNIFSDLLENILIVDNIDNATEIAKKYNSQFKMVTLDGEFFSTRGAITGGSRRNDTGSVMSTDRRIEENALLLKSKSETMEKVKAEKDALEKEREKAIDDLAILNDKYNTKRQDLVLEREKQSAIEITLSSLGNEIETTIDLIKTVNDRIEKVEKDFLAVSSGSEKIIADRESAQKNAEDQQVEFDFLKERRDVLSKDNTEVQVAVTTAKAKLEAYETEIVRLEKEIDYAQSIIERNTLSNESAVAVIESLKQDEDNIGLSEEDKKEINKLRGEIDNIENYKTSLREQLAKDESIRNEANNAITALTEKKHNEEITLAKIDTDLDNLKETIWESYQATYDTALADKEENYDVKFGESEIIRLRKKRASLGAINAQAIEDSKLLRERYDEMVAQRDDLAKAEDDLKVAIDKIRTEMLTQFDEGFAKINENFQKIFKELFGGGRAMLELDYTNATDKLEAGVEIIAEPPGKKLQKLSLLSGGEKALTAIAILFSILKLRPMPFCVLDEIEAALDEANVDRFARYLQKFSRETQFIVITHRKPTMELADALFGVTMQEKGISNIVSVKLSDIEKIDDSLS